VSHSTLLGASRRSATASVVPRTTKGVTTTRAS
jgi:hypothetical protein